MHIKPSFFFYLPLSIQTASCSPLPHLTGTPSPILNAYFQPLPEASSRLQGPSVAQSSMACWEEEPYPGRSVWICLFCGTRKAQKPCQPALGPGMRLSISWPHDLSSETLKTWRRKKQILKLKEVWQLKKIEFEVINWLLNSCFFSCCLGVYSGMDVCVGPSKRYRMKAIQTSKSCGIVCMYTSFTTTDTNTRNQLQSTRIRHTGTHIYCSTDNPHTISQRDCDTKQTS